MGVIVSGCYFSPVHTISEFEEQLWNECVGSIILVAGNVVFTIESILCMYSLLTSGFYQRADFNIAKVGCWLNKIENITLDL